MNRLVEKQQQMFSVVERYLERSGTQEQFCRENSVTRATLGYWVCRYRKHHANQLPTFSRVISSESENYTLTVFLPNGIRISGTAAGVVAASRELIRLAS